MGGGVVAAIVLGVFIVLLSGLVLAYYLWYKNKDDEIMLSESDNERVMHLFIFLSFFLSLSRYIYIYSLFICFYCSFEWFGSGLLFVI